jgi:hypothetical protein
MAGFESTNFNLWEIKRKKQIQNIKKKDDADGVLGREAYTILTGASRERQWHLNLRQWQLPLSLSLSLSDLIPRRILTVVSSSTCLDLSLHRTPPPLQLLQPASPPTGMYI